MRILRVIGFVLFLLLTAYIALYLFLWVGLILLIAAPFVYLYWRHKLRKFWKRGKQDSAVFIHKVGK